MPRAQTVPLLALLIVVAIACSPPEKHVDADERQLTVRLLPARDAGSTPCDRGEAQEFIGRWSGTNFVVLGDDGAGLATGAFDDPLSLESDGGLYLCGVVGTVTVPPRRHYAVSTDDGTLGAAVDSATLDASDWVVTLKRPGMH